MAKRPKRVPPKNVRFSARDEHLMLEDMAKGPGETMRFRRTFDNQADGNNEQELE